MIAYNDDNITELLTTIIETRYNAQIDIAKYAMELYELAGDTDYDLILMDNSFNKDPFGAIADLRKQARTKKTPIAIFTSMLTEETYKKAFDLDVIDFLSKPFSLDHIYLILDYILHKKGYREFLSNRRSSIRCDKKLYIKYNKSGIKTSEALLDHMVTTEDISCSGMKFSDSSKIVMDDELELEIMLGNPHGKNNIRGRGKVKWAKQNDPSNVTVGVEFLSLSDSDRLRLNNTIYSH